MRSNAAALGSNRRIRAAWQAQLASHDRAAGRRSDVEEIVSGFHDGEPCRVVGRFEGAFNHCSRLRFPIPGDVMYPAENTEPEVAVMEFFREKTRIPVCIPFNAYINSRR